MLWPKLIGIPIYLVASFCTKYAPLDGSRFSFPPKRCLTPEFMEAQFLDNTFGKERILLASKVQDIAYNGFSMPLALEASLGWESGHTVTAIADIILREILGVNTTFACTWGSVHAMKMLGGCRNPMDPATSCVSDGVPELPVPLAHVSVESWVTTPAEVDEMNTYNTNLGMVGYYSKSGLYMDKAIAVQAYTNSNISLEWWQSFVDIPNVADYFDSYEEIMRDIEHTWPDGSVSPRCRGDDSGYIELQSLGFSCTDGWFFGPACQANKASCVPVVLAEYDWNGLVWIRAIVQHGYRFAITWLGSQNWLRYSVRSSKRLLFYCATTSALCYEKPIVKMFADTKMPVGRPDLITSLLKVVWKQLPNIDARVVDFLSQMNIHSEDLQALMTSYSERQAWTDVDKIVPEIACDWLTNKMNVINVAGTSTGLNTAKWARWIPRVCRPGHTYDKAVGECRPCKNGEYSLNGRSCSPCSPGTYALEMATATCSHCEEGKWQNATGGTSCDVCQAGTQRSSDDHGCQQCGAGHFTHHAGQRQCMRCELGTWIDEVGATKCNSCSFAFTTTKEAATSSLDCSIDPAVVFQIVVVACLPFGAILAVVFGWRLVRHRRQLKESREREQLYFRGAVAVMRTMCSSGVTLTITPDGYIKDADPKDGLEGLKEGIQIQDCITDTQDLERFNRHLQEMMSEFVSADLTAFASPFNFSIKAQNGDNLVQLKSFAVAFKRDEILMGIKRKKKDSIDQQPVMPLCELAVGNSDKSAFPPILMQGHAKNEFESGENTPLVKDDDFFDANSALSICPGSVPKDAKEAKCQDDDTVSFCLSATTPSTSVVTKGRPVALTRDMQTQTDVEQQPLLLARPPILPGAVRGDTPPTSESPRRGRSKRRSSRSSSRSNSRSSSTRLSSAPANAFLETPKHTICFMLSELAQSVNLAPSQAACCTLHGVLDNVQTVARDALKCNLSWKPHTGWQCQECCALNEKHIAVCSVCSFEQAEDGDST